MSQETTAKRLYDILTVRNFDDLKALDSRTSRPPVNDQDQPDVGQADMFSFDWTVSSGRNYGTAVILLNTDNELELYFGDNLGRGMDSEDKQDWYDFLLQLKQFATKNFLGFKPQNINRLKFSLAGQAAIKEGLFEGWRGTATTSWNGSTTEARIMVRHKRRLGENDARYRYIESVFIETTDGERYRLPFVKLSGAKAMLEHVRQGGRPYDSRGQHIANMVEEINVLSRFRRAVRGQVLEGVSASLVEQTSSYYESLGRQLIQLHKPRGYQQYFESWDPAVVSDQDIMVEDLRGMFVEQSLDSRIEAALPVLARIHQGKNMKEVNVFEQWANELVEGTWALPDTPKQKQQLIDLMSQELPVGADATNASQQLYDLIGDDELFDRLGFLADQNADADARPEIAVWMSEHLDNPDIADIYEQIPDEVKPDEFMSDTSDREDSEPQPMTEADDNELDGILHAAGLPTKKKIAADYQTDVSGETESNPFSDEELAAINVYLDDEISFQELKTYPGLIEKITRHFDIDDSGAGFESEMSIYDTLVQARDDGQLLDVLELAEELEDANGQRMIKLGRLYAQAKKINDQKLMSKIKAQLSQLAQKRVRQDVAEGPDDGKAASFTVDDIKNLEKIGDFETLKAQAKELIKGKLARRMKPEKISWFYNHIDTLKNPMAVIKMMYDLMLAGEGNKVIGSRNSMSANSYRSRFGEQRMAEGSLNEGQYEMMMRNGHVKKFIAKDDADAKRIAKGHGAKSVIKLKGGVPAGPVTEQGMSEGKKPSISRMYKVGWNHGIEDEYHDEHSNDPEYNRGFEDGLAHAIGPSGLGRSNTKRFAMADEGVAEESSQSKKLTLDDVWRQVERVVADVYPDGDPIDWLTPWLKKHGITDFKVGEILDRAAKKNGYKDMYDYYDSMGDLYGKQDVAEGLVKDIKRLATGRDAKSRAGQEIAKSQAANIKGDHKTSKKHFDRYDKLDKLANKQKGVAEGLEDSNIQSAIVDTVEKLFRKNNLDDYDSLEAVRQGVKHHFSKPGATAESAVDGILNILTRRMANSGNYVDLSRFKEALRQGVAHQLKKQGVTEGLKNKVHLKTPKFGLADHPGRNTGVGLRTFAQTPEQDRCPKCNSLFKNHYYHYKQDVAEGLSKPVKPGSSFKLPDNWNKADVVYEFLTKHRAVVDVSYSYDTGKWVVNDSRPATDADIKQWSTINGGLPTVNEKGVAEASFTAAASMHAATRKRDPQRQEPKHDFRVGDNVVTKKGNKPGEVVFVDGEKIHVKGTNPYYPNKVTYHTASELKKGVAEGLEEGSMSEDKTCNMSEDGTMCPTHGLAECGMNECSASVAPADHQEQDPIDGLKSLLGRFRA